MSERRMMAAAGLVAAGLTGVAAVALARLPAGTRLPTHWNGAGQADGFASAPVALLLPVALTAGVSVLFWLVPRLEPLQHKLAQSRALLDTAWGGMLAIMTFVELLVAAPAWGVRLPPALSLVGLGLLLVVIGNALPKSRPGFFIGIRTPWSIVDADNWVATHRLGAWTFIAGGIGVTAAGLLPMSATTRQAIVIASVTGAALLPVLWSWWRWHSRGAVRPG